MSTHHPLSHVRVLDLSRILAGPWATQMLADLGADVIKIERPGQGDDTRRWGPPWVDGAEDPHARTAAYYLCANRNKRSLTVDIATPEGQKIIRDLACKSDVIVENFKTGGLEKYGLDYVSLKRINPRLVYCSITGFGHTGPYANRAGYDFLVQGMGGLMSVTGRPDDEDGAGPMKVGVALTDILTGLYAANAIQAALVARDKTGSGQHIDLALLDVQVACLANQAMNYLVSGSSPERLGNAHPNIVPYQEFPTQNGYMILAVGNDRQFARFCEEAERPELATDDRFSTNAMRVEHRKTLIPLLNTITVTRTTEDWVEALESRAVPCGPINDIAGVFANPQVQARQMQMHLPHAALGTIPSVANPMRFSATPIDYRMAPPALGEHTDDVLQDTLELSREQIDALRQSGIV